MQTTPFAAQLSALIADRVFAAVHRQDLTHYTRNEMQEAFRAEAIARGVPNETQEMGFVVGRCMSRAGFGA